MRGRYANPGFALAALLLFAFPLWSQNNTKFIQGNEVAAREVLVKFRAANLNIQSSR